MDYLNSFKNIVNNTFNVPPKSSTEYENNFECLRSDFAESIAAYVNDYNLADESAKADIVSALCDCIIDAEKNRLKEAGFFKKGRLLSEDSVYISSYVIPLFDSIPQAACNLFCDSLVNAWAKNFKEYKIIRGSFSQVDEGFETNWFQRLLSGPQRGRRD